MLDADSSFVTYAIVVLVVILVLLILSFLGLGKAGRHADTPRPPTGTNPPDSATGES